MVYSSAANSAKAATPSMIINMEAGGPNFSSSEPSLYERLGGKAKIDVMTSRFFHHLGNEKAFMDQFFVNVPILAIQLHQGRFFEVLFGTEEERCSTDELLDYMIVTHVRLFRDSGLDETHFDTMARCFKLALTDCTFKPSQIDECVALFGSLRPAFAYGAEVASQEKTLVEEGKQAKLDNLPMATMSMKRSKKMAALPPGIVPPSQSLIDFFDGDRESIRAWTSALTQRFVVQDKILRQLFSAVPYLEMEPYLHAFLELAFCPDSHDPRGRRQVLQTLRFPLGLAQAKHQLRRSFFERMIAHVKQVGKELAENPKKIKAATDNLKSFRGSFVNTDASGKMCIKPKAVHRLRRDHVSDNLSTSCRTATSTKSSVSHTKSDDSSVSSDISNLSLGSWGDVDFGGRVEHDEGSVSSAQRPPTQQRFHQISPNTRKNPIFAWLRGRRNAT